MLTYDFDKTSSEPVYVQIYKKIKNDIELGVIKPDEKLPSKRAFSAHLGLSVITIESAYNQLIAEGYIRSVSKKGYFAEAVERSNLPVNPEKAASEIENVAEDNNENQMFPFAIWAKLIREELSSNQDKLLTKPPFEGVWELRKAISDHLNSFRSINASPDQIIIGAGTEYLYMLINLLFGNNYIFAVEDPGYSKIADIYSNYNIKCERIPVQEDGIDVDYLRKIKADVIHISPSHHFPTGVITSIGKRYSLLEWASQSPDRYIIEDDYDSEFRLSGKPVPSLYSIDVMDKVIYMNTFSKSLSSTIRISYMVLPMTILKKFKEKLGFYSCAVSAFEQYTLARFISEGYFEKHINRMRLHYGRKRQSVLSSIKSCFTEKECRVIENDSGLHFIIQFDTNLPDKTVEELLLKKGIKLQAITHFNLIKPKEDRHQFIINYSNIDADRIMDKLHIVKENLNLT